MITASTIRQQLQTILMDTNYKSWDADTLAESMRMALAEISAVYADHLKITDLDSATETTLPYQDLETLIIGAASYAAAARSLDLAEKVSAGTNAPAALKAYAADQRKLFEAMLEKIRLRNLNLSTLSPHSQWAWIERPPNFEGYSAGLVNTQTSLTGQEENPGQGEDIMERESRSASVIIVSSAALSSIIDSTWAADQGLITPAALEAATKIAFKVAASIAGPYLPLYDEYGSLVEIAVTLNAAKAYVLPDKLFVWPYFKLWTEASGVDVVQSADRTFTIIQKS